MSNQIQNIDGTEIISTSVEKINSNFTNLKNSLGTESNLINHYRDVKKELYDLKIYIDQKFEDFDDRLKAVEDAIKNLNELFESYN